MLKSPLPGLLPHARNSCRLGFFTKNEVVSLLMSAIPHGSKILGHDTFISMQ